MAKDCLKCLVCGRVEKVYSGLKYYRLPKITERRNKWLRAIHKQHLLNQELSENLRVCEKHFSKDMYSKVRLKFSATPNLNITDNAEGKIDQHIDKENIEDQQNELENFKPVVHNENAQLKEFLVDDHTDSFNSAIENVKAKESQNDVPLEAERALTEHQPTQTNFKEIEKKNANVLNTANNTIGENKIQPSVTPHRLSSEQIPENEIIDKPQRPLGERTYLKKKVVNALSDTVAKAPDKSNNASERPKSNNHKIMTSEPSKSNIIIENQMPIRITNEHKEIECLEAVVKYTTQMQSIVKQKGGLDSIIQANTHLIKLLDKVVYEWFQRAQRRIEIGVITDELFIEKALESKQIFCIQNFDPDDDWLKKFKTKYNITDLDMRLLHIQNNSFPPSVDIYEIVLYVLKKNPIVEYFSNTTPNNDAILVNENNIGMQLENEIVQNTENDMETVVKTEEIERLDEEMDVPIAISNDEQARLHLKPLEEYVLLKDNFRAVGLISQLIEIFSTEIKKEET